MCFSAGRAFPPQVAHGVFVDSGKRREVGDGDVFVDLVQRGAVRAEFDGRRAVLGEEARIGGASAGVQLQGFAGVGGNGGAQGANQYGVFGEEGFARQFPLVFGADVVPLQGFFDKCGRLLLQAGRVWLGGGGPLGVSAGGGGDDVFRAAARREVAYLEAGWREVGVAFVPAGSGKAGDNRTKGVDGVAHVCRIGDVSLFAVQGEMQMERATAAMAGAVAQAGGG